MPSLVIQLFCVVTRQGTQMRLRPSIEAAGIPPAATTEDRPTSATPPTSGDVVTRWNGARGLREPHRVPGRYGRGTALLYTARFPIPSNPQVGPRQRWFSTQTVNWRSS
ncbi:hypothetical protein MCHIJ_44490 [Mycolicibacterium chitae]|nr:hypothetical protein MCHIJ_44490 [Mycolicibacterium chitae]